VFPFGKPDRGEARRSPTYIKVKSASRDGALAQQLGQLWRAHEDESCSKQEEERVSEKSTRKAPDYAVESRAAPNRSLFSTANAVLVLKTHQERYNSSESGLKRRFQLVNLQVPLYSLLHNIRVQKELPVYELLETTV